MLIVASRFILQPKPPSNNLSKTLIAYIFMKGTRLCLFHAVSLLFGPYLAISQPHTVENIHIFILIHSLILLHTKRVNYNLYYILLPILRSAIFFKLN